MLVGHQLCAKPPPSMYSTAPSRLVALGLLQASCSVPTSDSRTIQAAHADVPRQPLNFVHGKGRRAWSEW